jgi:hypothetical protein
VSRDVLDLLAVARPQLASEFGITGALTRLRDAEAGEG